jgi:branched-chain amino acid transport system substrate-binding protein
VLALAVGALVASSLVGVSGASSTPSGTPIKIGYLASETGFLAPTGQGTEVGVKAFITAINKEGGYHGHPLTLVVADDQSNGTGAQTGIKELISDGVFAIINNSSFFNQGNALTLAAGIPVMGATTDGPEWGQQPNTNLFNLHGGMDGAHEGLADIGSIPFLKSIGVKTLGGLAIGISPSSKQTIEDYKTAASQHGISMPYENLTLPYTPFDVTPLVLAIKSANVQAVVCSCAISTYLSLITGLKQAGVHDKALVLNTVDTTLVDTSAARAASQGYYLFGGLPSLSSASSLVFEDRLHAVDPAYKVGTYTQYDSVEAYLGASLIYKGLQLTGSANPTTQEWMSHVSKLTGWTADGLLAYPESFNHFGSSEPEYCEWVVQVHGSGFTSLNGGKQYCLATPSDLK